MQHAFFAVGVWHVLSRPDGNEMKILVQGCAGGFVISAELCRRRTDTCTGGDAWERNLWRGGDRRLVCKRSGESDGIGAGAGPANGKAGAGCDCPVARDPAAENSEILYSAHRRYFSVETEPDSTAHIQSRVRVGSADADSKKAAAAEGA